MLRPLVAFAALCLVALLLAPTVASVHDQVEALHIKRDNVWHLWKWTDNPQPPPPEACGPMRTYQTAPVVTVYSTRMAKDQPYTLGGVVRAPDDADKGVMGDRIEVYLNETKTSPGRLLGTATSDARGQWTLSGKLPFSLQASHYHVVAHSLPLREQCKAYGEGWSDPEVDVTSRTHILLEGPFHTVAGRPVLVNGTLLDAVNGPVANQGVRVSAGGQSFTVTTDSDGRFSANLTPSQVGRLTVIAEYGGNPYYSPSSADGELDVLDETITLNGAFPGATLQLVRSTPLEVNGRVYLRAGAAYAPVNLTFSGLLVRACDGCPLSTDVSAPVDADGAFHVTLFADSAQTPGPFGIVAHGGGLRKAPAFNGSLMIPTRLALAPSTGGPLSKGWSVSVQATDDKGALVGIPIAFQGPAGWAGGYTNATGGFATSGTASACGPAPFLARYNGTGTRMPAESDGTLQVCGGAVSAAAGFLHLPWWAWLLVLALPLAAWVAWRRLRERFASTISEGPPLTLSFEEPRDAAAGVVGLGEAATLAAFLEEPLPDGYRMRLGTPVRMEDVEPEGLAARYALVPDAFGDVPVRAEVLDARGRVVTRRTRTLRVVRYAEEIERRYLALRASRVGESADPVSPREFEAWLRGRSASLDPEVARRLVGVFEEADYGPRVAGRRELLAYLDAESALPEVAPLASE